MVYPRRALLVASLAMIVSPVFAQTAQSERQVTSKPLNSAIQVTATIGAYLNLRVGATTPVVGPDGTATVRVTVMANTPWRLEALLASDREASSLQQLGGTAAPVALTPGQVRAIPCQVPHFAGEHLLQFAWSGGVPQWPGTGARAGGLQLWLEAVNHPGQSCHRVTVF
jgi:hypothetical protein